MFRIDNSTAAASKPAPAAAGTPGYFTEGNPVGGVAPTVLSADFMNSVQEELMSLLTDAGVTPDKTATNQILDSIKKIIDARSGNASRVLGLTGRNNATTPATKLDLAADQIVFRNAAGFTIQKYGIASITCDIATQATSAAPNGRDQSTALAANSSVNFFYVLNPVTGVVGLIASANAPTVGPSAPTGFTYWAFATSLRNGASALQMSVVRGSYVQLSVALGSARVLSAGASTTMQTVSCASFVPSCSTLATLICYINAGVSTANSILEVHHRTTGETHSGSYWAAVTLTATGISFTETNEISLALNASQQFDYKLNQAPSSGGAYVEVTGYYVPNGDI